MESRDSVGGSLVCCESVVDEEEEEDINRKECKLKACGIHKHDSAQV